MCRIVVSCEVECGWLFGEVMFSYISLYPLSKDAHDLSVFDFWTYQEVIWTNFCVYSSVCCPFRSVAFSWKFQKIGSCQSFLAQNPHATFHLDLEKSLATPGQARVAYQINVYLKYAGNVRSFYTLNYFYYSIFKLIR